MAADIVCPRCGHTGSKVVDTRGKSDNTIRRRRECLACTGRWTTAEAIVGDKEETKAQPVTRVKTVWSLSEASFLKLLRTLQAVKLDYNELHEALEEFFEGRTWLDSYELADKVIDILARKLEEGLEVENVKRFCFGVAHIQALKAWREQELYSPLQQEGTNGQRESSNG